MLPHLRRPTVVELYAAAIVVVLAGSVAGAALTSRASDWRPLWALALLAGLAIGADAFTIRVGHMQLSGSFIALVLVMVVLGPAPATVIGLLTLLVNAMRTRRRREWLPGLTDIATYAVFPLAGGLLARALLANGLHVDTSARMDAADVALAVAAVYAATNLVNFALIAVHYRVTGGRGLLFQTRTLLLPMLPSEAAGLGLTALVATAYAELHESGPVLIGLVAVLVVVFIAVILSIRLGHGDEHDGKADRDPEHVRHRPAKPPERSGRREHRVVRPRGSRHGNRERRGRRDPGQARRGYRN